MRARVRSSGRTVRYRGREGAGTVVKPNRKYLKRALAALVVILSLMAGGALHVLYTAYSAKTLGPSVWDAGNGLNGSGLMISSYTDSQLVQKILDAMSAGADVLGIYESIPSYQMNGITYEEFYQYTFLLKTFMKGEADTYASMTISERKQMQERIIINSAEYEQMAMSSSYFWIMNSDEPVNGNRFPLLIRKNIQGEPYLSRDWVTGCINLCNYGNLYISVLEDGDAEELAHLLDSKVEDAGVRRLKAETLISFYRDSNINFDTGMVVSELRMDEITYTQRAVQTGSGGRSTGFSGERSMRIVAPEKDVFVIRDEVPMVLKSEDRSLYSAGHLLFEVGGYADESDLRSLIGTPQKLVVQELPAWIEYSNTSVQLLNIQYDSMNLQVLGTLQEGDHWEGVVRSVAIYRPGIRTGSGIEIGSSTKDLLLKYPFMDQSGYTVGQGNLELHAGNREGVWSALF